MRSTLTPGGKDAADRTATAKTVLSPEDKQRGDACYDRLSNPKNFHGIYRERFKEKGLIEGEEAQEVCILRLKLLSLHFSQEGSAPRKAAAGFRATVTPGGKNAADRTTTAKTVLSVEDKQRGDACYDRLTNPKNFHGIYKERFKEKGLLEEEGGSPSKSPAKSPVKAGAKASPSRSPAKASPKKAGAVAGVKAGAKPKPIVKPAAAAAEAPADPPAPASPAPAAAPAPASPAPASPAPAAVTASSEPTEDETF